MQEDSKHGVSFLNENLVNHFIRRDDSIIGTPGSKDVLRKTYKTYAFELCDVPYLTYAFESPDAKHQKFKGFEGLQPALEEAIEKVEAIISGLVQAKKSEKPEGSEIKERDIRIHWRQFPSVNFTIGNSYSFSRMSVSFRISIHHKEILKVESVGVSY